MVGDAVRDAAHRVLADAEPQVAAGLVGPEVLAALDVRQVRFGQVGRAAEQLRQRAPRAPGSRPGSRCAWRSPRRVGTS